MTIFWNVFGLFQKNDETIKKKIRAKWEKRDFMAAPLRITWPSLQEPSTGFLPCCQGQHFSWPKEQPWPPLIPWTSSTWSIRLQQSQLKIQHTPTHKHTGHECIQPHKQTILCPDRSTHKHGLHVRRGSLVDGNQLSALQPPRLLSSLQTNPVREVAATASNPMKHTHSQTHTDHGGDMGENTVAVLTSRQSPGTRGRNLYGRRRQTEKKRRLGNKCRKKHTKSSNKAKKKLRSFPGRVCEEGGGEKSEQIRRSVSERRETLPPSPPPVPSVTPVGRWVAAPFFLCSIQRSPRQADVPYHSAQSALCSQNHARTGSWHSAKLTHSHLEVCTYTNGDTHTVKIQ